VDQGELGFFILLKVKWRKCQSDPFLKNQCDDDTSFSAARRLIRTEGILCGGSCGSAIASALAFLKSDAGWEKYGNVEGKNVVVLLADG
jgi:cysteine synthase